MQRISMPILVYVIAALFLLTLILAAQATASRGPAFPAPLLTPTPTGTPFPIFSATMAVIPSAHQLALSETLTVTISISVSEGCQFPIYALTLDQHSSDGPAFAYRSPSTHTVGPPVSNPFSYTLTATSTGTVVFYARAFGERYCGDYWNWTDVSGKSEPVRVGPWPYHAYLPAIQRCVAPAFRDTRDDHP